MRRRVLLFAVALNAGGVLIDFTGWMMAASLVLVAALITAVYSLRLLEPTAHPAKVKGVHTSFPVFVRLAYIWALVAGALGIWAASVQNSHGIWGASRHSLTVGFLAMMVFTIGQRVLPAFSGMRLLFSTKLRFFATLFLAVGCLLRVSTEILAYQGWLGSAWAWLPVSAITEMTAVTLFATNLLFTFVRRPPSAQV